MKTCTKCREFQSLDTFSPSRHTLDGRASWCRACVNTQRRERYASDAEVRERLKAKTRARAAADPAAKKAADAAYYARNPKRAKNQAAAWALTNPERSNAQARAAFAKRRAEKVGARVEPGASRAYVGILLTANYCAYCPTWLPAGCAEVDHVVPLARGGAHAAGNLVPACRFCNRSKGSKLLEEWSWPTFSSAR